MKKLLLLLIIVLGGTIQLAGETTKVKNIPFQIGYDDPTIGQGNLPRNPIEVPDVSQDGHILYFNNVAYDLELVLLDEDGDEVYSTLVTAGTSAVVLPSTLTGDYELQLYPSGEYYFYSDITL